MVMKTQLLIGALCLGICGALDAQSAPRIVGVPTGGTTGQTLQKASNTNFDVTWGAGGGGGAPTDATYITQTANGSLSAEQALASLSTGIMAVTATTGVVSSLTDSAGVAGKISDETGSGALVFATSPTLVTPALGTPASGTLTNCTGGGGYIMTGGSVVSLAPADGQTYFFGDGQGTSIAQKVTIATAQMKVPKAGTITRIEFHIFVVTNGTNENVSHLLRLNNTTDTSLSTTETYDPGANTTKDFSYTGLSIAVAVNDTIAFKVICPTWTTNPTLSSSEIRIWIE